MAAWFSYGSIRKTGTVQGKYKKKNPVLTFVDEKTKIPIEQETILQTWPGETLFAENIKAIQARNPELAQRLMEVTIPESAELTVANDGSVTYRIRQDDGRKPWLGYSSVPLIVARENIKRTDVGYANLAMDSIASGAEAKAVLQKMAPFQALFVTESNLVRLALALRIRDFSTELRAGRLLIFMDGRPAQEIEAFLNEHPGYNIVNKSITWAWRSDRENQEFAQQLSLAMQRCTKIAMAKMNDLMHAQRQYDQQHRATAIDSLRNALQNTASLRIANCTQAYTPTDCWTSRDALTGAKQLGAEIDHLVLDQPDKVSNIAQLERLNRLHPSLILLVDRVRGDFAYPLPETSLCASLWRQANQYPPASEQRMGNHDFICTAHQHQLKSLRNAGYPQDRTMFLPLFANTELYYPIESRDQTDSDEDADVLMVADRCRIDPQAYQIKLPFQQQLWYAVAEEIRKGADTYHSDVAHEFLTRAERRSRIDLKDEELQTMFLTWIQNGLGETILRDTYADTLVQAGIDLKIRTWSRHSQEPCDGPDEENLLGWSDSPVHHCVVGSVEHEESLNRMLNRSKIVVHLSGFGFVDNLVLNAVAAGTLVLVRAGRRDPQPDGIGWYFDLGKEIITFESASDLLRKVRYYLSHDTERTKIAHAARETLLERHSCHIRMQEMLNRIHEQLSKT